MGVGLDRPYAGCDAGPGGAESGGRRPPPLYER